MKLIKEITDPKVIADLGKVCKALQKFEYYTTKARNANIELAKAADNLPEWLKKELSEKPKKKSFREKLEELAEERGIAFSNLGNAEKVSGVENCNAFTDMTK